MPRKMIDMVPTMAVCFLAGALGTTSAHSSGDLRRREDATSIPVVECNPDTDTHFNLTRAGMPSLHTDYGGADVTAKDVTIELPLEERGITFMDPNLHAVNCTSYFLNPRALIEAQGWSGNLDDKAFELMTNGYDPVSLTTANNGMTQLSYEASKSSSTEKACRKYWHAHIPLHQFTSHRMYSADEMSLIAPGSDSQLGHYGAYVKCAIGRHSDNEARDDMKFVHYAERGFIVSVSIPFDFKNTSKFTLGDATVKVKAEDRPIAENTDSTNIDVSKMYKVNLFVGEFAENKDNVLRWGEAFNFSWRIDTTLDYLHYERLDKLEISWSYADASNAKNNDSFVYYHCPGRPGDAECVDPDEEPYLLSEVNDPTDASVVFPTNLTNQVDKWAMSVLLPPQIFLDSEKQRAFNGDPLVVVSITFVGQVSTINPAVLRAQSKGYILREDGVPNPSGSDPNGRRRDEASEALDGQSISSSSLFYLSLDATGVPGNVVPGNNKDGSSPGSSDSAQSDATAPSATMVAHGVAALATVIASSWAM